MKKKTTLLFIFGTRPEAIKMAPLIQEAKKRSEVFETYVCLTAQHRGMLDQVMSFFEIKADFDLNLMIPNQTLFTLTANAVKELENCLNEVNPDYIFVQGDTTTAFAGALCGFYKKAKVVHIEAGLRSHQKYSPFPEEINRLLVGRLADFHFCPTEQAQKNLADEKIVDNVWVVGNTVIDALFLGLERIKTQGEDLYLKHFSFLDWSKRLILVTGHRRESFGKPFEDMCQALLDIVTAFPDVEIVYPVHLNPNVQEPVFRLLKNHPRIHLIEPLDYPYLIWLMNRSYLVLTDSGGIQEEAPALGKPVLVMREVTERTEGIEAGTAKLVGTDRQIIVKEATALLQDQNLYSNMSKAVNPYGDGHSARLIFDTLQSQGGQ